MSEIKTEIVDEEKERKMNNLKQIFTTLVLIPIFVLGLPIASIFIVAAGVIVISLLVIGFELLLFITFIYELIIELPSTLLRK